VITVEYEKEAWTKGKDIEIKAETNGIVARAKLRAFPVSSLWNL